MTGRKIFGYFIVLFLLAGIGYGLTGYSWMPEPSALMYTNERYGLSLSYPDSYTLQEREVGNGERGHYSITIIDTVALANLPEAGEGPPSITIDIYQNDLDKLTVEQWIRNTSASNFKLSPDEVLIPNSVAGVEGLYYRWDGLYPGESIVIAHKGNIVVFSATHLSPDDQIRQDFNRLLGSVVLQ